MVNNDEISLKNGPIGRTLRNLSIDRGLADVEGVTRPARLRGSIVCTEEGN